MKDLNSSDFSNKRVLMRVDFNVPIRNGVIQSDTRIKAVIPTIKFLQKRNCKITLMSHLGRPKGKDLELSLKPVALALSKLLNQEVKFADDCINIDFALEPSEIILLENTRFYEEDKKNDPEFSKKLANNQDIFIMEAFATAHRKNASTYGIQDHLESYYGLLVNEELTKINKIIDSKEKPFIAVLGGKKITDKIDVVKNLLEIADYVIIGGGMPFPFYSLKGIHTGLSMLDAGDWEIIKPFLDHPKLLLPIDYRVADNTRTSKFENVDFDKIPEDKMALDIGEKSIEKFTKLILSAKKVVWNGPVGVFENPAFAVGSKKLGEAISKVPLTLIGGGDTISAIENLNIKKTFTHISTGGGAVLEILKGKQLIALR